MLGVTTSKGKNSHNLVYYYNNSLLFRNIYIVWLHLKKRNPSIKVKISASTYKDKYIIDLIHWKFQVTIVHPNVILF
jgi:hypothetical protein